MNLDPFDSAPDGDRAIVVLAERRVLGEALVGLTPRLAREWVNETGVERFTLERRWLARLVAEGADLARARAACSRAWERGELALVLEAVHGPGLLAEAYTDLRRAHARQDLVRLGLSLVRIAREGTWRQVDALLAVRDVVRAVEANDAAPGAVREAA